MRLTEQFTVDEELPKLWTFLEQVEQVAACVPGIEAVEVVDPDNLRVRVTQAIGPMSATFDSRVRVLERVEGKSIRFEAIGKSVRGAIGSVRATNSVTLKPADPGTLVTVEGDIALAGALGSVGQKVVARQANKVTAEFASNLRRALSRRTGPGRQAAGRCRADADRPARAADRRRAGSGGLVEPRQLCDEPGFRYAERDCAGPDPEGPAMSDAAWMANYQPPPQIFDEPSVTVNVEVNGQTVTEVVPTRLHAADFLRYRLGLTGTHVGCEQGVCGMCTVLVDGLAVKSCLMLAAQLDGRGVDTVESLAGNGDLTPLQERFKEEHALQCGFCTPAFLMTATALARQEPGLSRDQLREELSGVMCRCTGYEPILTAVQRHLATLRERGDD